jgi:hypothetical protein
MSVCGLWSALVAATANTLADQLLRLQGDGDYHRATAFINVHGKPDEDLQQDLGRIDEAQLLLVPAIEQGDD